MKKKAREELERLILFQAMDAAGKNTTIKHVRRPDGAPHHPGAGLIPLQFPRNSLHISA